LNPSLVISVLFAIAAVISWTIYKKFSWRSYQDVTKAVFKWSTFGLLGLAAFLLFIASANQVPVRNVGIETSFGKPTGQTTGSGLHFVAPWKKIADWDASIQTSDHASSDRCVNVRIGSMATACIEEKVRWQVKPEAAPEQWMSYKGNFDNMENNLFETELQNATNEVFATYNPINSIDIKTGQTKYDGTQLAEDVKAKLIARVGNQINVESVVVPLVHHDEKTEGSIKAFQDVVAQKRILEQKYANAQVERQTAELLSGLPPTYQINKCLDIAKDLGKEPGLCLSGGGVQTFTGK
jgi:regulator of protease activity HflC (stomatin/prohibitin superfamily)